MSVWSMYWQHCKGVDDKYDIMVLCTFSLLPDVEAEPDLMASCFTT